MLSKTLLIVGLVISLMACQDEQLEVDETLGGQKVPKGIAAPLSKVEYQNLSVEKQYQTANKLASTLFKGVPADEFFNFNTYDKSLAVTDSGSEFIVDTRKNLSVKLKNKDLYTNAVEQRHSFSSETRRSKGQPLAAITEYPISRDQFEAWMAYVLANTILFSPAEEIDTANYIDVDRIYDGLSKAMSEDVSIRDIIYAHMKSEANWRRFRSPEDNTREMIEIYLGLFDRDEDVPKASIACKNYSLTDANNDARYRLKVDFDQQNTVPQNVLGSWITTCDDFFQLISNHALVIPRMTTYLVDCFFPTAPAATRSAIVADIVATNPVRFHDIFTAIIFSKEYLMNTEKPKSFEETFFNLASRIDWRARTNFLNQLVEDGGTNPNLRNMNQPAMTLKLGRFMGQPLDSLSFAYYHKAVRERLFTKTNGGWGAWGAEFRRKGDLFSLEEYVHFLFLSTLSRKATQEELDVLVQLFVDTENETDRNDQAIIVFDYISRLPELYYFKAITTGDA